MGNLCRGKNKKPIPFIDKIILGPLDTYLYYDRFPWAFLAHILCVIFCTAQIMLILAPTGEYSVSELRSLYRIFLNEEIELEDVDFADTNQFFDYEELREYIYRSIENYEDIENAGALEQYTHIFQRAADGTEFLERPLLEVYFIRGDRRDYFPDMNFNLTTSDLGPFELQGSELRLFLSNLTDFRITYKLKHKIPSSAAAPFDCFIWRVYQDFDYFDRNHITQRVNIRRNYCEPEETGTNFLTRYIWLNTIVILVSVISIILHLKILIEVSRMFTEMISRYMEFREREKEKAKEINEENEKEDSYIPGVNRLTVMQDHNFARATMLYENVKKEKLIPEHEDDEEEDEYSDLQVSFSQKYTLCGHSYSLLWIYIIMVGDLLQIIGSIFLTINTSQTVKQAEILLGFGSFITWLSMVKYFENSKGFNIITNTTINSMGTLLKSIIGIGPLIFGAALLALCFFNPHNRYGTGALSIFSLSALMYGDSIFDLWYQTRIWVVLIAEIFNYVFLFVAIMVIMNAFIMIVGDGYEDSKGYEKQDWINKELPEPTTREEKSTYLLLKILKKDRELVTQEWKSEQIKKKEEKLGKKIGKTEEEEFEEEQAGKSMEYHTRRVINLMREIKLSYLENKEKDQRAGKDTLLLDQQYRQIQEDLRVFLEQNQPLEDKHFYF